MANPSSVSKEKLSGSTDGRPIKIAATSTPGTTIHTAKAGTTSNEFDEIWLWGFNSDTASKKVTIEFGGTSSPDDTIEVTIPAEVGLFPLLPGLILQNSCVVKAFCASANLVMAVGYVNRISG